MRSPKMNMLGICALGLISMFEMIEVYHFSFMGVPALLAFMILFIGLIYFSDNLFYYGWGLFCALVVFVPIIIELFHSSRNIIAFIFYGILSLFLFIYFGYKVYKKIKTKETSKEQK